MYDPTTEETNQTNRRIRKRNSSKQTALWKRATL